MGFFQDGASVIGHVFSSLTSALGSETAEANRIVAACILTFLIGFPVLFAILHSATIDQFDKRLSGVIHSMQLGPLDYLFIPGAYLWGYLVVVTSYPAMWYFHSVDGLLFVALSGGVFQIVARTLKIFFNRQRPDRLQCPPRMIYRHPLARGNDVHGTDVGSMPSADTGCAGFVAGTMLASGMPYFPALLIPMYAGFARIYWGYHWLGDTIIGTIVGLLSSQLVAVSVGFGNVTWPMIVVGIVVLVLYVKLSTLLFTPSNKKDPYTKWIEKSLEQKPSSPHSRTHGL
eukprot:m.264247 g.264247  ORF g.264247 m.264247 type:complete len:287 (-) comp54720_c0_seq1:476-1336(-)